MRLRTASISVLAAASCLASGCKEKTAPPVPTTPTAPAKLNTAAAKKISTRAPQGQSFQGLRASDSLPYIIAFGQHGDLDLEATTNVIMDGQTTLGLNAKAVGIAKSLQIQHFLTSPDTVLVQVDAGPGSDTSLVGATSDDGRAPVLIDPRGSQYIPIGYYYEDESKLVIRFTPGDPILKFTDLPTLTRSRPSQKLTLLFRVSAGVSVRYFALSNTVMVEYDPPVPVTQTNR